jgi:AcrR family transcriptional regulator
MSRRAHAVRDHAGDPAAALHAHLLDTADGLLADSSPTALTTRGIARAAGVSDGVLYNHFADKDELVLAATVRRFARRLEAFLAAVPEAGSGTVPENLERIAEETLELHRDMLPILVGLLADPELLGRFLHEIHREHIGAAEIVGTIARYLAAERESGRVGAVDAKAAADLLVGAVAVATLTTLLGATPADAADRSRATVAALLRGLEPRP